MSTKKYPAGTSQQGNNKNEKHDKKELITCKSESISSNVIISNFAPGFNDQVAKNIITNLYQIYFRERGQENIEINVYNKDGELIV